MAVVIAVAGLCWTISLRHRQVDLDRRLLAACQRYDGPLVEHLLGEGADPNVRQDLTPPVGMWRRLWDALNGNTQLPHSGPSPLAIACRRCDTIPPPDNARIVQALLEAGGHPNEASRDEERFTPLLRAIFNFQSQTAVLLIDHGADVNVRTQDGWTPLMWAVLRDDRTVVHVLLDSGADVNARSDSGWTALICAADGDGASAEITELLLSRGAKVNARTRDSSGRPDWSALTAAAIYGKADIVRTLIHHGADVTIVAADGRGLVEGASANNYRAVARILRRAGAQEYAVRPTLPLSRRQGVR